MNESELLAHGYRKYTGEKVDVYFNLSVCTYSGNCGGTMPSSTRKENLGFWLMPIRPKKWRALSILAHPER